jgi:hypothetical protein
VKGPTVNVAITLSGARIVSLTTTKIRPDEGHIHIKLDGTLKTMTAGLSSELQNVSVGSHVVLAEFVAADHVPFDPRVFIAVTFEVT